MTRITVTSNDVTSMSETSHSDNFLPRGGLRERPDDRTARSRERDDGAQNPLPPPPRPPASARGPRPGRLLRPHPPRPPADDPGAPERRLQPEGHPAAGEPERRHRRAVPLLPPRPRRVTRRAG